MIWLFQVESALWSLYGLTALYGRIRVGQPVGQKAGASAVTEAPVLTTAGDIELAANHGELRWSAIGN